MNTKFLSACEDLLQSIKRYRLWVYLGWSDIKLRYQGSVLGPLWITLSMTVFIVAIGTIYSHLFHEPMQSYIPYLTSGLLVWNYIATTLVDCNEIFFNSKHFINHIPLPFILFIYRVLWRNIIIFFHNFLVYFVVMLYFGISFNWHFLLFLPGFLLLTMALTFLGLLVALIGTRFRDIPQVINSVIQIVFFISPIAWKTNSLVIDSIFVRFNPVTYFLDVVRSPLLGQLPQETSWIVCFCFVLISMLIVTPIFATNRTRIPFWL